MSGLDRIHFGPIWRRAPSTAPLLIQPSVRIRLPHGPPISGRRTNRGACIALLPAPTDADRCICFRRRLSTGSQCTACQHSRRNNIGTRGDRGNCILYIENRKIKFMYSLELPIGHQSRGGSALLLTLKSRSPFDILGRIDIWGVRRWAPIFLSSRSEE
jgi:hypothetical protein